jgi:hypothetical protein
VRETYQDLVKELFKGTLKKKGALQNPSKRFCTFSKASKCVQSLKKRIKNSTEPFLGSEQQKKVP